MLRRELLNNLIYINLPYFTVFYIKCMWGRGRGKARQGGTCKNFVQGYRDVIFGLLEIEVILGV